ncbi:MAG TPA: CcdB family protein [Azospirillaceae bacterium]|nr:CcdB family protein [Azospirillaceae bacterium]
MRFLDVCANPDASADPDHPVPYLLVVQGDYVDVRSTRLVIPLVRRAAAGALIRDLTPVVEVAGETLVLMTPQMASIRTAAIGRTVGSLGPRRDEVRRAIDILTGDL